MSIILFILALDVLILSHELGHFLVAKKNGIRVDEFAIGFPPRLLKFKKGETLYSIGLFPIGGFVKIHGEGGEDKFDSRSFSSKSVGARSAVIVAGVICNLVMGWVLMSIGFMAGMPVSVDTVSSHAEVSDFKIIIVQVNKNSPAEQAGLFLGDEIDGFQSVEDFQNFILENAGKETEINYKRGDEFLSAVLTPRVSPPEGEGSIGIAMDEVGVAKFPWYYAVWEGLKATYNLFAAIVVATFYFFYDLLTGASGIEQVMGPVGIVNATGAMAKLGFTYFLSFIALLSVNLAVINIIPFPALDGGRLLFLLIEKIKGSPVNQKYSNIAHSIGFLLLLLLMFIITYQDILRMV